jgi:hypothetical protein
MAGVWLASATSNLMTSCENFIVLTIRVTRLRWMSFYRRRASRMPRSQARGLVLSKAYPDGQDIGRYVRSPFRLPYGGMFNSQTSESSSRVGIAPSDSRVTL